eukprot:764852-Hanusia_phi.AAC.2
MQNIAMATQQDRDRGPRSSTDCLCSPTHLPAGGRHSARQEQSWNCGEDAVCAHQVLQGALEVGMASDVGIECQRSKGKELCD